MWKREHRATLTGVDDLVNYAFLVRQEPGVVLLKDGAFLRAWYFQGPDLDYAVPEELERLSQVASNAFQRCGNGWMLHLHSFRRAQRDYMERSVFPDPTSALIDEERRRAHEREDHFTSIAALTLTYKLSPELEGEVAKYFYEGKRRKERSLTDLLATFLRQTAEMDDLLQPLLNLQPMAATDLLTYLHMCVTGIEQPMVSPALDAEIDSLIADQDLTLGFTPQIGQQQVRVISIDGHPGMTQPGAQDFLHELAMPYIWSTRFTFLDARTAGRIINKKRMHWKQKVSSLGGKAGEALHGGASDNVSFHAIDMARDAMVAAAEAESGEVIYGIYTMTVVVMDEDERVVEEQAREVQKRIQNHGYGARIEEANAPEAFMGTWPGHGYENVRAVPIHSLNLADLLPLTSIWAGQPTVPNPYFAPHSPALMLTATSGKTPFFLTPWIGDVGMQLVLGPIGSGKSTFLGMQAAQFLRYPGAQVFWFDKGYSSYPLCQAVGGQHYDIGADETVSFTPLAGIRLERTRERKLEWVEECLRLQGMPTVTPEQRAELWTSLNLLATRDYAPTLTMLQGTVQDQHMRNALSHYAMGGAAGALLDAKQDSLAYSHFMVFEMEHLLNRGDKDLIPVMLYLCDALEQRLEGRPTLILIDEAWLMILRAKFGEKVEEWLRTLRKKNAAVIFTSQSLTDVERCPQRNIIVESCQTKIFLPNAEAETAQSKTLYLDMGLNEKEIHLLRFATPKKHYLYHSPLGRRLFDMSLGRAAMCFVGATGREDIRRVQELAHTYGEEWPAVWLRQRGCEAEAAWWLKTHEQQQGKEEQLYETLFPLVPNHTGLDAHSTAVE